MNKSRRNKLFLAFAAILVAVVAFRFLSANRLSREARQNFEWFSTLGFPDGKGLPFVRVTAPSEPFPPDSFPPDNSSHTGCFLLSTNSNSFTVLLRSFITRTYTNTPPGTPEEERVSFAPVDFRTEVRRQITALQSFSSNRVDEMFNYPTGRNGVFTFAWVCWRHGMNSEAIQLYDEAKNMPPGPFAIRKRNLPAFKALKKRIKQLYVAAKAMVSHGASDDKEPTLTEGLRADFSEIMLSRAALDFGDLSLSRSQLLEKFERCAALFPGIQAQSNALVVAANLKKMIVEDNAHPRFSPEQVAAMPQDERIRELIFQLRDLSDDEWRWKAHNRDDTSLQTPGTPARQLVALGFAAVPQMIEAFDSNAYTRVGFPGVAAGFQTVYPGMTFDPDTITTVGGTVREILERLSGRDFATGGGTAPQPLLTNQPSPARASAAQWWADFQSKGEKQTLIDGVAAGGDDAPRQAEMLADKYPDSLDHAIIAGIRASGSVDVRERLVELLVKSGDPASVAFLKNYLQNGPTLLDRVATATALRKTGAMEDAMIAMIREWPALSRQPPGASDVMLVAQFLRGCDSPDAVAALAKDLRERPVENRYSIVEMVGDTNFFHEPSESREASPATLIAVESLLAGALDDTAEALDNSLFTQDPNIRVQDPRVSDAAAHFLSQRWPVRYKFDITRTLRSRERQRIQCLNVWRQAHQLAALPLPPDQVVRVTRADAAKITSVEWAQDSLKPGKPLETRISKLNGRRLRLGDLEDILANYTRYPEPGTGGLDILAERDDDLSGVQVNVRLLPPSSAGRVGESYKTERVAIGAEDVVDQMTWLGNGSNDEEEADFEEAFIKALAAAPDVRFNIRIRLVAESP